MVPMSGDHPRWVTLGATVRGAHHQRMGQPNQDALSLVNQSPWLLALSDGHGSTRCFRSDRGARFAVTVAKELVQGIPALDASDLRKLEHWVNYQLPKELVRRWRDRVDQDLMDEPIAEEDRLSVGKPGAGKVGDYLAYGATLILVVATERYIAYLQLGDGDILVVRTNGEVTRPLPGDARLMGNETTSLCMDQAWREIRTGFQVLDQDSPALILAATDGYANAFRDDGGFLQAGSDFLDLLREMGPDAVQANLATWLEESSANGSGDDITLGLLFDPSLTLPPSNDEPGTFTGLD